MVWRLYVGVLLLVAGEGLPQGPPYDRSGSEVVYYPGGPRWGYDIDTQTAPPPVHERTYQTYDLRGLNSAEHDQHKASDYSRSYIEPNEQQSIAKYYYPKKVGYPRTLREYRVTDSYQRKQRDPEGYEYQGGLKPDWKAELQQPYQEQYQPPYRATTEAPSYENIRPASTENDMNNNYGRQGYNSGPTAPKYYQKHPGRMYSRYKDPCTRKEDGQYTLTGGFRELFPYVDNICYFVKCANKKAFLNPCSPGTRNDEAGDGFCSTLDLEGYCGLTVFDTKQDKQTQPERHQPNNKYYEYLHGSYYRP